MVTYPFLQGISDGQLAWLALLVINDSMASHNGPLACVTALIIILNVSLHNLNVFP